MKKALIFLCVLVLIAAGGSAAFANGIINDTISDVNALFGDTEMSTNVVAARYNPAGTTKLSDGLYIAVSNAMVRNTQELDDPVTGETYDGWNGGWLIPGLQMVYGQDNWAAFFAFYIAGGGGSAVFDDGSPVTDDEFFQYGTALIGPLVFSSGYFSLDGSLDATSSIMAFQLGGAYEINAMISIALGGRFCYGKDTANVERKLQVNDYIAPGDIGIIDIEAELEDTASGWGGVIGINITPMKDLNIGITFLTAVKMEYERNVKKADASITDNSGGTFVGTLAGLPAPYTLDEAIAEASINAEDGSKEQKDIPAQFSIGVAYQLMPALGIGLRFNYFFEKQADWDGEEDDVTHNSYEIGGGIKYTVMPALIVGLNLNYENKGADDEYYGSYESGIFDTYALTLGVQYEVMKDFFIRVGYAHQWYKEIETVDNYKLKEDRNAVAVGVQYKIM